MSPAKLYTVGGVVVSPIYFSSAFLIGQFGVSFIVLTVPAQYAQWKMKLIMNLNFEAAHIINHPSAVNCGFLG